MPAQRLAMVYSALGDLPNALHWAEQILQLLPEDAPPEMMEECNRNLDTIRQALEEKQDEKRESS